MSQTANTAGSADDSPEPVKPSRFTAATQAWFTSTFGEPTPAQAQAWQAIGRGEHTLVVAPTGSGKTLAAFLSVIDSLISRPDSASEQSPSQEGYVRVLYISPLKALAADVDRNLRAPLAGISQAARDLAKEQPPGQANQPHPVTIAVRTSDTSPAARRRMATHAPDILITTPESLFLLLTSRARRILERVQTVIVDEIHSLAGTKRGAHLAVSLERLDARMAAPAQRIGLSATVRPIEEVARFLCGGRAVTTITPPGHKSWDLSVTVPVADLTMLDGPPQVDGESGDPTLRSIWPHIAEQLVDLIAAHRSTLVFTNSRRLAERLTARINEIWHERTHPNEPAHDLAATGLPAAGIGTTEATRGLHQDATLLARAHHGSVSRAVRMQIEEALKAGTLPAVVATSTLELGIDMGLIDLVVQVEAPPSVASGLQRVGRAGHQVGAVSQAVFIPKNRSDLVQTAVVVERMRAGLIESVPNVSNPLDVLAQQIVAMCAVDTWHVEQLATVIARSAPFASLAPSASGISAVLESVLDMLSGRYPAEQFASLRPRLVWDRTTGTLTGRPGAQRLAVISGGTIPDRGLFGVFLPGDGPGRRVGELDEELVYESRVGDVIVLGTSAWRIEDITHDQVRVSPAPGQPGRLPFWKGEALGRSAELGAAQGAFVREVAALPAKQARERAARAGLHQFAADNLVAYLDAQLQATGAVPTDESIVVERFRDELGDWQVVIHSPYGAGVHAPWALCIGARLRERYGVDVAARHADDGIVLRLPGSDPDAPWDHNDLFAQIVELIAMPAAQVFDLVAEQLSGSALFAARFRECAARALLLPRPQPTKRQALWQQRQRSAQLLEVAAQYPQFPIILETVRECLQDVFDVPALTELMEAIGGGQVNILTVHTRVASPFAQSLLFGYMGEFIYEGDTPLGERRVAALDSSLLAEVLGHQLGAPVRDVLDPATITRTEEELQGLAADRAARSLEPLADLLRRIGPLSTKEVQERTISGADVCAWLAELAEAGRIYSTVIAGESRWAVIEDAGRLQGALAATAPPSAPAVFRQCPPDPLGDLLIRYARCHGPFTTAAVAQRLGIGQALAREGLSRLAASGQLIRGQMLPGHDGEDWCDREVLRTLKTRSLQVLRSQIEPVSTRDYARFLGVWQGVSDETGQARPSRAGTQGLLRAIEQLSGLPVAADDLEAQLLPARVRDYRPEMLDELLASGDVVWCGHRLAANDQPWVSLHVAEFAAETLPAHTPLGADPTRTGTADTPVGIEQSIADVLGDGGGYFVSALTAHVPGASAHELEQALWRLAWGGHITSDTFEPVRALLSRRMNRPRSGRAGGAAPFGQPRRLRLRAAMTPLERPTRGERSAQPPGRWSMLPTRNADPTARALACAESLLDRYAVLSGRHVAAENVPGGFAAMYRVLSAVEQTGSVRRGYFVQHLGAAQFAATVVVDRIRALAGSDSPSSGEKHDPGADGPECAPDAAPLVLSAIDPANPYGAALDWPQPQGQGHHPARRAGALVILVGGALAGYVEVGRHRLLTFAEGATVSADSQACHHGYRSDESTADAAGAPAVACEGTHPIEIDAARAGAIAQALASIATAPTTAPGISLTITSIDGQPALNTEHPVKTALLAAGFHLSPRGLRCRAT